MKELLNIGQALGRDEMKKLMAGSGTAGSGNVCHCKCGNIYGGFYEIGRLGGYGCETDSWCNGPCYEEFGDTCSYPNTLYGVCECC